MSKQLKPGDRVIFNTRNGKRGGEFVRYIKPRVWPPEPERREYCLVQTRHSVNPIRLKSDDVSKDTTNA